MAVKKPKLPKLSFVKFVLIAAIAFGVMTSTKWIETVEKGTYQVKQAAITGTMDAKMTPGIWYQGWGDIDPWPKAETFFFTSEKDAEGDTAADNSIEVRFNDGSVAKISGTARVIMPISPAEAIALTTERGHKTYMDVQQKLIFPTVRNVLRSTSNLMTARESYNEKRLDFVTWARDQIENGVYQTDEVVATVEDLVTGEKVRKNIKVIRRDKNGQPMYQANPLGDTGIRLVNFEIKSFKYEDKVRKQISKQQEARMNVETAKAKAEEARQEELRTIAEGKQKVAAAKYEQEQEKIRAVVSAQKDKEVAELQAAKLLEVAKLNKAAAAENKAANILDGQGIAEKNRLILQSDGALDKKLDAYIMVNKNYAKAISDYDGNWVPTTVLGGGEGGEAGGGAQALIQMLSVKTAKELALDTTIRGK